MCRSLADRFRSPLTEAFFMYEPIIDNFRSTAPQVEFCSLRLVHARSEYLSVRQHILQPVSTSEDMGAMITVVDNGGMGYAATSDLTVAGLHRATDHACAWARSSAGRSVVNFSTVPFPHPTGEYASPMQQAWNTIPLAEKIDLLRAENVRLKTDDRIVDWDASLWYTESDTVFVTADGGQVQQHFRYLVPMLTATANAGTETQSRTFAGRGYCRQGGL